MSDDTATLPPGGGPNDPREDIGPRGLVIYGRDGVSSEEFEFVNESTWRRLDPFPADAQSGDLASLIRLKVAFARLEKSVFVNLDQLEFLPDGQPTPKVRPTKARATKGRASKATRAIAPSDWNIIVKEGDSVYVVPKELWSTAPLGISGDAGVLINRGAVLAPIPTNSIAEGTFCLLINLAALT